MYYVWKKINNYIIQCYNIIKRRYCVIIYFGQFWPPNFCPIPALYTKLLDLYYDIYVFSSNFLATYMFGFQKIVSVLWLRIAHALLPILKGTRENISADHALVQTLSSDCDMAVDPSTYMWNGFLKFCRDESTKNHE